VPSLWYHSHALKQAAPNVFEMFDNDFHNQTSPTSTSSRLIDVTVDETNKTAHVSWSWTSPKQYWTPYWGEVDRLPNGDRLGTFGTQTHSIFWNNLTQSSGAVLVEVNPSGEVVRTYTFPEGWGIYRAIELNITNTQNASEAIIILGVAVAVVTVSLTVLILTISMNRQKRKRTNPS
jgi:hypothetical protein